MAKVFITRRIPDIAEQLLKENAFEVKTSQLDRPMTKAELIAELKSDPYEAVITLINDVVDKDVYDAAPKAKIFANYGIGFNNLDIEEAKKRGIFISNTPHGGAHRVAEFTFGLILSLACHIKEGDEYMKQGKYTGWDPMLFPGLGLNGKVLGLIGLGSIGAQVAHIGAQGFGMKVMYYDLVRNEHMESDHEAIYSSSIEEVLKQSDVVSLHVPLNDSTKHLINHERLSIMKKTAYLINTSRGAVIDEKALVLALQNKDIAGAGLDVLENEPDMAPGLKDLNNVILSPHIASATEESRQEMAKMAAMNIINTFKVGKPVNLVYN